MKKKQKIAPVIAALFVLIFAVTFMGCPEPGGGGGKSTVPSELLGKWISQSGAASPYSIVVLEFTKNQLIISDTEDGTTQATTYFYTNTYGEIEIGTSSSSLDQTFCESYEIKAGVITFTGGDYSSTNFYKVTALPTDQWKDGVITSDSQGQVWYSFNVTGETTYRVWWNDSYEGILTTGGNGLKTLDIYVSSYYSSGTSIFNNVDTAWSTARSFTPNAAQAGTVYVKVTPASSSGVPTGTFALLYSATVAERPNAPFNPSAISLTANQWKDGEITAASNGAVWYSFSASIGTIYNIWWNDGYEGGLISGPTGNGTKTLDVKVSGYYSDGTSLFTGADAAWSSARSITPTKGGTFYLKVMPYTSGNIGTFGIVYNTGTPAEKPTLAFNPPNTPLTADEWADGAITVAGSYAWYSLTVTAATPYYFWWNESGDNGNSSKSLNVSVSAYNSDGTAINDFNNVATAWTTAKSYTPTANGTIFLRVASGTSGQTGTYGILYSATNTRPVAPFNPPNPIALATDVWANGELTSSIREVWYSFPVTAATPYRVWWNDTYGGNGTKTGDVYVAGFYNDGTSAFTRTYSKWNTAQSFTPATDGTVYLKVTPFTSNGTFGIVYSDNSTTRPPIPVALPSTATPLTANTWTDGSITSSVREAWYSFEVTSGIAYRVWWNESGNYGDGSKTLDVRAGAWYSDGTNIFEGVDSAWSTPQSFTPTANGTVYIRITPYSPSANGTFGITYNADSATMPPIPINPVSPTVLTVDTWADGAITAAGGEVWYSFTVTANTPYRVWWNDSYQGNGTKTCDVYVAGFYNDGTVAFTRTDSGWTTERYFTPTANDTVYIKITGINSIRTGTFGVVYSTSSTRPIALIELPTDATELTADEWEDGNIPTSGGREWFTFTATATPQYIHIKLGTLDDLYVQVYDSNGAEVEGEQNIDSNTYNKYISRTVTANQTYYIRVRPYGSTYSGNYKIAFTTSTTAPTS